MHKTDSELMEASKNGDSRAFDELVGRYADRVYAFTLRLSGDRHIAEDASQDAFIKVWKNRKRYDTGKSFRPWLFAIARNAAFDVMRKRREFSFSSVFTADEDEDISDRIVDETVSFSEHFDQMLLGGILEEVVQMLTPDQKAAVMLHDVEGLTFDEASKVMNKPLNTIKSHYRRAIMALRKQFSKKGYTKE